MKKNQISSRLLVVLLSIVCCVAIQGADEIPRQTESLIVNLEKFERSEWERTEKVVMMKRKEVAKVLDEHLLRETRAGNLNGAVKIEEKIRELTKEAAILFWFTGKTWTRGTATYLFLKNGKGMKTYEGQVFEITWESIDSETVQSKLKGGKIERFAIDSKIQSVRYLDKNGRNLGELTELE